MINQKIEKCIHNLRNANKIILLSDGGNRTYA